MSVNYFITCQTNEQGNVISMSRDRYSHMGVRPDTEISKIAIFSSFS
jgi:hypothetical protein